MGGTGWGDPGLCDRLLRLSTGQTSTSRQRHATPLVLFKSDQTCTTFAWQYLHDSMVTHCRWQRHRTVMQKAHENRSLLISIPPIKSISIEVFLMIYFLQACVNTSGTSSVCLKASPLCPSISPEAELAAETISPTRPTGPTGSQRIKFLLRTLDRFKDQIMEQ